MFLFCSVLQGSSAVGLSLYAALLNVLCLLCCWEGSSHCSLCAGRWALALVNFLHALLLLLCLQLVETHWMCFYCSLCAGRWAVGLSVYRTLSMLCSVLCAGLQRSLVRHRLDRYSSCQPMFCINLFAPGSWRQLLTRDNVIETGLEFRPCTYAATVVCLHSPGVVDC